MFSWGKCKKYKSPEEREKERQQKKHKETCAKKRKARKKKKTLSRLITYKGFAKLR